MSASTCVIVVCLFLSILILAPVNAQDTSKRGLLINKSIVTTTNISDKEAISELVNISAYHRDRGNWDQLRDTFWANGTISFSWFDGPIEQFVNSSRQMSEKGVQAKHIVSQPFIKVNGNRAVSEANVILLTRGSKGPFEIDLTAYARFYDLIEKREGSWRIFKRTAIYEKDRIDSVQPSLLLWISCIFTNFKKYPKACRFLGFMLGKAGYELVQNIVEDKSKELDLLYKKGDDWLSG